MKNRTDNHRWRGRLAAMKYLADNVPGLFLVRDERGIELRKHGWFSDGRYGCSTEETVERVNWTPLENGVIKCS